MKQRMWAVGAVLAILSANTGCVSCCSKSYATARDCAPDCALPAASRSNVYVFMVHGLTPTTGSGLETLREKLAECGFAKVGIGELAMASCMWWEIKQIARYEPEARFVLLGYDLGAPAAVCVARDLASRNIPVEAVVLLDPVGCGATHDIRTIIVASGSASYSSLPYMPRMVVSEANHFQLPSHPKTVAAVAGLLEEIASRNCPAPGESIEEWSYPPAPEMHPLPMPRGDEWDILSGGMDTTLSINTRVMTSPTQASTPPSSTTVGAVPTQR